MKGFQLEGCRAMITGASAGIGREFARQLASRVSWLALVARRRDRLETLRHQLLQSHPELEIELHETDLSDREQVLELMGTLAGKKIDLLINNAGLGDLGSFVASDPARVSAQIRVNVLALTLLARAVLPVMTEQRRGAILNVSSSAGFLPIPGFAVYAATKAYVTSFSEAIRAETRGSGVTVTTLCPGPVKTEFTQVADRQSQARQLGSELFHVRVEKVVQDALRGLERGRAVIIPGVLMKAGMAMARSTPLAVLRAASRFRRT